MIVFYYSHGGNTARFVADRLMPELIAGYEENDGLDDGRGLWIVRILSNGPRSPISNLIGWGTHTLPAGRRMRAPHPQLDDELRQGASEAEMRGLLNIWSPALDNERAIIVVPTYGSLHNGNVPENAMPQAIQDLIEHIGADKFEGIVAMGNRNFGKDFAGAGAVTEIPLLAEIELAGNRHEAKIIAENLFAEKENKNV